MRLDGVLGRLDPRWAGAVRLALAMPFYLGGVALVVADVFATALYDLRFAAVLLVRGWIHLVVGYFLAMVVVVATDALFGTGALTALVGLGDADFITRTTAAAVGTWVLFAPLHLAVTMVGFVLFAMGGETAALLYGTRPPEGEESTAVETVRRLCQQVDVPTPAVRVAETSRPVCLLLRYPESRPPAEYLHADLLPIWFTDRQSYAERADGPIGLTGADPDVATYGTKYTDPPDADTTEADYALVLSTGLLDTLTGDELTAVLAHEVGHLANRDAGWMNRLLLPLFWVDAPVPSPWWYRRLVRLVSTPGVATFARGREYAADRAAARITGDPGALASALQRLDDASSERPDRDLRAVAALNVVPTLGRTTGSGMAAPGTHPPTAARIERLRRLADGPGS